MLMLSLTAAGCNTTGPAALAEARGGAIAFESIEGPPAGVVQKFARAINDEASARQLAVVPRGTAAPYRIRGYLAVNAESEAPSIAWAWDVYDGDERRAFRLSGVEPAGAGRRSPAGAWASADDALLRKIARAGVEQFVAFIASPRAPGAVPSQSALAYANPDH